MASATDNQFHWPLIEWVDWSQLNTSTEPTASPRLGGFGRLFAAGLQSDRKIVAKADEHNLDDEDCDLRHHPLQDVRRISFTCRQCPFLLRKTADEGVEGARSMCILYTIWRLAKQEFGGGRTIVDVPTAIAR